MAVISRWADRSVTITASAGVSLKISTFIDTEKGTSAPAWVCNGSSPLLLPAQPCSIRLAQ